MKQNIVFIVRVLLVHYNNLIENWPLGFNSKNIVPYTKDLFLTEAYLHILNLIIEISHMVRLEPLSFWIFLILWLRNEDLFILELSDDLGTLIKSIEDGGSGTGKNLEDLWIRY